MKVIKGIAGSKKWAAAFTTVIGLVLNDLLGIGVSVETIGYILTVVLGVIAGESAADAAGAFRASKDVK